MSDYNTALSHFQKIPAGNWSKPEIGLNLAVTLKKLGNAQDAAKVFGDIRKPKNQALARYYSSVENYLGDKL